MAKVIISLLCIIVLSFQLSECQQDYCYDDDENCHATEHEESTFVREDSIWKKQIPEPVFGPAVNLTMEALKDIEEMLRYVINDEVRYLISNISNATRKSLNQFIESS